LFPDDEGRKMEMTFTIDESATSKRKQDLSIQEIAECGEAIYREKYQAEFEQRYNGKFVVVNIITEEATLSDESHEAIKAALHKDPEGAFHLMRVGRPAAFRAGWRMSYGNQSWIH
jgi:hypothetical protein